MRRLRRGASAITTVLAALLGLVVACSDRPRPPAPTPANVRADPPPPPSSTPPPVPEPVPLPARPFRSGDVLDAPAITLDGAESGDVAFGFPRDGSMPSFVTLPLPRGCRVVKRTRNVISLRCPAEYGAVFGFYSRLTLPYEATRRRFGGVFSDYGRIGVFRASRAHLLQIDIAKGEHASLAVRTGGAPLRVLGEPEGPIGEDPPLPADADGTDRFLRAFGAYRCGASRVEVNVRSIVWTYGEVQTECRRLAVSPGEGGSARVICGEIVGRETDLGSRGARYRSEGLLVRGLGTSVEIDGQRCSPETSGSR